MELVKTLKKKYQKTIYRRINKGVRIEYDENKGIVDEETKEVIISLDKIVKNNVDDDEEDNNDENENDEDEKECNEDEKEKKDNKVEKDENKKDDNECEDIDTNSPKE